MVILVTIPKSEQYKIPVWQDVKIMMSLDWTSSTYDLQEEHKSTMFQNLVYTVRYNPLDRRVNPVVNSNY